MNKNKGIIAFCIIFLIILVLDFLFYKNIDIFLPTLENKLYSFEDNLKEEQKDFLIEMYEIFEMQSKNNQLTNFNIIKSKETIYNLIRNNICRDYTDKEFENIAFFTDELSNTIYGDLKTISIKHEYTKEENYLIIYSEDMQKIYYLDVIKGLINNTLFKIENENVLQLVQSPNKKDDEKYLNEEQTQTTNNERSKTELVSKGKMSFANIIKNIEFEPQTIIYRGSYYILKDNTKDITVYYETTSNVIFGLYIGFGKE